jgi:DNA-binding transcriptional MerR regulator
MRIGELARRTGVSERSLRYYEKQGLLTAERTLGGHRDYPDGAVDRVIRIQELFAAGLHSKKIVQLLPCMRDADGGPSEIATPRLVNDLVEERERIDRMMADLVRSRDVLDEVINAASDSRRQTVPHLEDQQSRALPGSGNGTGEAAISRS